MKNFEKLECREKCKRVVGNLINSFIYRYDTKGVFTYVSPSVTKLLGYSQEEFLTPFSQNLTPHPVNETAKHYSLLSRQGIQQDPYEIEIYDKEGKKHWFEMADVPLFSDDQTIIEIEGIAHNITRRKQVEQKNRESLEFEKMLSSLSARFINVPADQVDSEIEKSLKEIAGFLEVEIIFITKLLKDKKRLRVTHIFSAFALNILKKDYILYIDDFPFVSGFTLRGEVFSASNVSKMPEEASIDIQTFSKFNVKSVLIVPLMVGGSILGFLCISEHSREKIWPEELCPRLKLICEIFANAIIRNLGEKELIASEEKFNKVFQKNPNPMMLANLASKTILSVNDAYIRHTGYQPEDVIDIPGKLGFTGASAEQFNKAINFLKENDRLDHFEITIKDRNGRELFNLFFFEAIYIQDKRLFIISAVDITERKRIENALKESEERLKLVLDATNTGFYDYNPIIDEAYASAKYYEILGYEQNEFPVNSKSWGDLIHPDDRDKAINTLTQFIINKGTDLTFDYHMRKKNGEWCWIYAIGKTVERDINDNIKRIIGITIDITDRKEKEQELKEYALYIERVIDKAPIMTYIYDIKDNKNLFINKSGIEKLGFTQDYVKKMRGELLSILIHPMDLPKIMAHLYKVSQLRDGEIKEITYRLINSKGEERIFKSWDTVFKRDSQGKVIQIAGSGWDITAEVNTTKELQKQHDFSQSLINTAQTIIMVLDTEGHIVSFNPYMEEVSGYKIEEVKGKDWFSTFLTRTDHKKIRKLFKSAISDIQTQGNINSILTKDGNERFIEWFDKTLKDREGNILGLLAIGQDVTERLRTEKELEEYRDNLEKLVKVRTEELHKAKEAAEAASLAKSTFLANMSHELRTPLNSILGFSQIMRKEAAITKSQQENLDIISRSGAHLLELINDVLEISKIEAGRIELEPENTDLGGLILDVIDMMRKLANEKDLHLILDQSSEFPRFIKVDGSKISQIFINLIGNAIKFTEQGGVTIRLKTKTTGMRSKINLVCEVEDTGIGISKDEIKKIFDPFEQAGKQNGSKGSGLGLAITQHYIELMGGKIFLESQLGKGSLFYFEIPVQRVSSNEVKNEKRVENPIIGLEEGQPIYRILIVEDQLENRMLLRKILAPLGFEIKEASNGEEALNIFKEWNPHLIWMDRRMPVMDGLEATKRIKAMKNGKKTVIVALTASVFKEQRNEVLAVGSDDFLRKPFKEEEIFAILKKHLGVKYIYKDKKERRIDIQLSSADFKRLPQELLDDLTIATRLLKVDKDLIKRLDKADKVVGDGVAALVKDFKYSRLLDLILS